MNNFIERLEMMRALRGELVRQLDKAVESGLLTAKEREVLYYRHVEWNSLELCGRKFSVTRERIRQIEAKALEKLRTV